MLTHLLYLHGFRSSPQSFKAKPMAAWVQDHTPKLTWWCPQLPPSPREAMAMVWDQVRHWPAGRMAVPEDIGNACLYIASPLATYASGCNLLLHGGGERPAFLGAAQVLPT